MIAENSQIYIKEVGIKTQKAYRTANRHNQRRNSPHNIIIRMSKMQNKELSLELSVLSPPTSSHGCSGHNRSLSFTMPPKDIKKKISLERPNPSKQVWEQDKKSSGPKSKSRISATV